MPIKRIANPDTQCCRIANPSELGCQLNGLQILILNAAGLQIRQNSELDKNQDAATVMTFMIHYMVIIC